MSDKFIFQNARIKALETKLLTSQNLTRVLDATSQDECFKILQELGFGMGITVEQNDFDLLFSHEEATALALLKEFNVDNSLDAFLVQADYNNLKALIKAEIVKNDDPILMEAGLYDVDALRQAVKEGKGSNLPKYMVEVLTKIERMLIEDKVTPHTIDTLVDKAMYQDILARVRKEEQIIKDYFVKKIDFLNIAAFIRCKGLGLDDNFFENGFIEGGKLNLELFHSIYEQGLDAFKEKARYTDYKELVNKVVDSGNVVEMEVDMDNALLKMWKDNSDDMFSMAPVVSYYLSKCTEIKTLKLIVAGIKNKVNPEIIRERMRDLYA